jgi:hypothetical protein
VTGQHQRIVKRLARKKLRQFEADGLVRWTGAYNGNGEKVYRATQAGIPWAKEFLDDHDQDGDSEDAG